HSDESVITGQYHENQMTLRWPKDAADLKTLEDNRVMRELDKAGNKVPRDLANETTPEASAERMKQARDLAYSNRKAEKKSTKDLEKITDQMIDEVVAYETAALHGPGKQQKVPRALKDATKKEIDKALKMLREGGKGGAAALVLLFAATA